MTEAFVSLATTDDYARGANVLGKSLKRSGTTRKSVIMITTNLSFNTREELAKNWDEVIDITELNSHDKERLAVLERPELGCTFTKLRAWTLTQFKKCVFLDADTMVLQNVDDLFDREELSAAPDVGWPDCFNSGVFVFKPSQDTYVKLLEFAKKVGSFDGGDQGLLNDFFGDWATKGSSHRLPFVYNMVANITYSYTPAFMRYGQNVKIVHFLGAVKPWHHYFDDSTGKVKKLTSGGLAASDDVFAQMWWDMFKATGDSYKGSEQAGPASWHNWDQARVVYTDRRERWEKGTPDYTGEDRFDNILSHMKSMMIASTDTTTTSATTPAATTTTGMTTASAPTTTTTATTTTTTAAVSGTKK